MFGRSFADRSSSTSVRPTERHAHLWSVIPSERVSVRPSDRLSVRPSDRYCHARLLLNTSVCPSEQPTDRPADSPCHRPTVRPSAVHRQYTPRRFGSSDRPTRRPSVRCPSVRASICPTVRPSDSPTDPLSDRLCDRPTVRPSAPSVRPSNRRRVGPAVRPSAGRPSRPSVLRPTDRPTDRPTVTHSCCQSSRPSVRLTVRPTSVSRLSVCPSAPSRTHARPSDHPPVTHVRPTIRPSHTHARTWEFWQRPGLKRGSWSCHVSRVSEEIEMLYVCVCVSVFVCTTALCGSVAPPCYALLCVSCCTQLCSAACFCVLLRAVIVVDPIPHLSEHCASSQDPDKHDAQTHANASTRNRASNVVS